MSARLPIFRCRRCARSKVSIGETFLENSLGDLAMKREALRLFVLFIPAEIEPAQTIENGMDTRFGIALDVGIVEAEDHRSAIVAGVEPVENECAGTANMQKTCGDGANRTRSITFEYIGSWLWLLLLALGSCIFGDWTRPIKIAKPILGLAWVGTAESGGQCRKLRAQSPAPLGPRPGYPRLRR